MAHDELRFFKLVSDKYEEKKRNEESHEQISVVISREV